MRTTHYILTMMQMVCVAETDIDVQNGGMADWLSGLDYFNSGELEMALRSPKGG